MTVACIIQSDKLKHDMYGIFTRHIILQVAPSLELIFLLYISTDVFLKLLWIKPKFTIKHRRTVLKVSDTYCTPYMHVYIKLDHKGVLNSILLCLFDLGP